MATSIFDDETTRPDDSALAAALGEAKRLWDAIVAHTDEACADLAHEWKFYGKRYGWQLKLADKKRAILYLIPQRDSFRASLALKEKAVEVVRKTDLPPDLILEIETAKVYPEGRPARIEVTSEADAAVVRQLVTIKLTS